MSNFALSKRAFVVVLFALYLIGIGSSPLESQTTATVSGTVADSSGALVPDALVRVKNAETGVTHSAVTDDEGRFRFLNLSIGTYDVEASKTGFKTFIRRPVTLGVGNSAIVDFSLEVGEPKETIFVEAAASLVETHSPAVSSISTFDQNQLQNLPLDGRNLSELVTMNPGVAAAMGSMSMGPGSMGMNMLETIQGNQETHSISGARTEGQAILLDNTNVQGFWNRGMGSGAVGSSLGIEAVANLQVLTSSYDARFGGNGSVANAVTKSGTNVFHGSVYEYLRNSALNARNFFDTTADPPTFRRNQFGASLGGPLQKDKLFFFFNYEGLRQAQSQIQPPVREFCRGYRRPLPSTHRSNRFCICILCRMARTSGTALQNTGALRTV
jgi:Carboxypeptidase regulatory-like domain